MISNYLPLRRAGAQVRAGDGRRGGPHVEGSRIGMRDRKSEVCTQPRDASSPMEQLVAEACSMPLPDPKTVKLKDPAQFTLIGRETPHLDIPDKCTGAAQFGLDVRVAGNGVRGDRTLPHVRREPGEI